MSVLETARALLFVPGNRPERFDKAIVSGADAVVIDLEDAVGAPEKDSARDTVRRWLDQCDPAAAERTVVRVNAAGTAWHDEDVAVFAGRPLMLPKAQPGTALEAVAAQGPVLALVESAEGMLDVRATAAVAGVRRLAFGNFDLASELGTDPADQRAMLALRTTLVLVSAAARLPGPVDGVRAGIDDETGLRDEAEAARAIGFTGKLCIHPRQVATVLDVLRPTAAQLDWARALVATDLGGGVVEVAGEMVDKPVIDRARRLLAAAGEPREEQGWAT